MADELKPQQKWYQTAPGYLTATAALVGSITAAVTGLSQLGIFHSKPDTPTPAPVVAPASATAPTSAQRTARRYAPENRAPAPAPAPRTPSRASTSAPAAAPAPATSTAAPVSDSGGARARTTSATAPRREDGLDRPWDHARARQRIAGVQQRQQQWDKFTTTTVTPVSGSNGVSLPVGTQVILSVVTAKAPVFITAKGISINVAGKTVPISGTATAQTEFNAAPSAKGIGIGACIPQGGRVSLRLTDGVSVTQP